MKIRKALKETCISNYDLQKHSGHTRMPHRPMLSGGVALHALLKAIAFQRSIVVATSVLTSFSSWYVPLCMTNEAEKCKNSENHNP